MKNLYFFISSALLLGASAGMQVAAEVTAGQKFNVDSYYYQVLSPGRQTVTLIKPTTYAGKYTMNEANVPATVTYEDIEFRVVNISKNAFSSATCTSIVLPNTVKSISESAFSSANKLTSITLPAALDSLGVSAFYGCSSLPTVNIPATVKYIGDKCFQGASSLTAVTVESGSNYFSSNDGMLFNAAADTMLYYPEGLTATAVTVPDGVKAVGPYCYYKNTKITDVTIPASVETIMNNAFDGCNKITALHFAEGLRELGEAAFQQVAVTSLALPSTVVTIGGNAFMQAKSLTNIVIPDRVDSIGTYAFYNNTTATDVTIGRNVRYMAQTVFGRDDAITNVVSLSPVPPVCDGAQFSSSAFRGTLRVPANAIEAYTASAGFSGFASIQAIPVAQSWAISNTEAQLNEGEQVQLSLQPTPADAYAYAEWSSSDPNVATVDNLGVVTAIAGGTATITAASIDGGALSQQCIVTVGTADGVKTITNTDTTDNSWYNLQGMKVSPELCKGQILIHRGKKVVIR